MTDPKDPGPIEEWSDQELLDHYRYTRTETAGESGSESEDANRPIEVIVEEIRRRGLPIPTSPVETTSDPEMSAGESNAEPEEGAAPDRDEGLSDQEEPPLIG